jgi:hypothetical protein
MINGMPTPPGPQPRAPAAGFDTGAFVPAEAPEEDLRAQPATPEDEPLPAIDDAILLQIMQRDFERAKSARETRKSLNRRNWDAFHGKFEFLAKKRAGQSRIVIPSLETSLEQVCAQLTEQLVGFKHWFTASYEGDAPPLPGLSGDEAARILEIELERLAVDGGCMPTTYGMHRLIYDSLKLGLIESEVTWKISMEPDERPTYTMENGQMVIGTRDAMRLRVDIVPFEDFYPDPSAAKQYMIHEMEVPVSQLPDLGFTPEEIDQLRHAAPGTEKLEEQRRRAGVAATMPSPLNRVLLREYWGDLTHPQTGNLIAKACMFMTAANTHVARTPQRIRDLFWHGLRPFIHTPLLPTPTAEQHHAFLDIAVPLIEAECELFNLIADAGFHAALGVKEIRSYMLQDQTSIAKGLMAGQELEIAEGYGDGDVIKRVDTGTLSQEMLSVYDRIARTRQEATRTNDLQLGRQAMRKTSATEINQIVESSDDLFSNLTLRFEDTHIEPALELIWLTLWQFADASMMDRIGRSLGDPANAQTLGLLTPEERFVAFASGVSFKAQGYKYQLQSVKNIQTLLTLQQQALQNPALMQVLQQRVSPVKFYEMVLRSKGIDPHELAPGPEEQPMNPALMQGQAGNPQGGGPGGVNPAATPDLGAATGQLAPPNQLGVRGIQQP